MPSAMDSLPPSPSAYDCKITFDISSTSECASSADNCIAQSVSGFSSSVSINGEKLEPFSVSSLSSMLSILIVDIIGLSLSSANAFSVPIMTLNISSGSFMSFNNE